MGWDGSGSGIIIGFGGSGIFRVLGGGGGGISWGSRDIWDSRGDGGRGIDRVVIGDVVIFDNLGNSWVIVSLVGVVVDVLVEVGGFVEVCSIIGSVVGEFVISFVLYVVDIGFLYMVVSGVMILSVGIKDIYIVFGEVFGLLVLGYNGGSVESKDESSDGFYFGDVGGDVILGIL